MAELVKKFEPDIESFTLVPTDGGRFEIKVNGELVYSKLETRRHPEAGEVMLRIREWMKKGG